MAKEQNRELDVLRQSTSSICRCSSHSHKLELLWGHIAELDHDFVEIFHLCDSFCHFAPPQRVALWALMHVIILTAYCPPTFASATPEPKFPTSVEGTNFCHYSDQFLLPTWICCYNHQVFSIQTICLSTQQIFSAQWTRIYASYIHVTCHKCPAKHKIVVGPWLARWNATVTLDRWEGLMGAFSRLWCVACITTQSHLGYAQSTNPYKFDKLGWLDNVMLLPRPLQQGYATEALMIDMFLVEVTDIECGKRTKMPSHIFPNGWFCS